MNSNLASPAPGPSQNADAQSLGHISAFGHHFAVSLPSQFATQAVLEFFKYFRASGILIENEMATGTRKWPLPETEWAFSVTLSEFILPIPASFALIQGGPASYVFPKHCVIVTTLSAANQLLRSLEAVKPKKTDVEGRFLPWVPVRKPVRRLDEMASRDDDATLIPDAKALPAEEPVSEAEFSSITDQDIRQEFENLARALGFDTPLPLILIRGDEHRYGFTTGSVYYNSDYRIRRIRLVTCPNSDLAEILATAVHELAHPASRTRIHGLEFKRTLVDLASRFWGSSWFDGARERLDGPYPVIDYWIATGIRSALVHGEPPLAKRGDDGQMARIVTKIRKLRELAKDQIGTPEGITATAMANDLITLYGLESYSVQIDAAIDDQMIDQWLLLADSGVWRQTLVSSLCKYCDVFALLNRHENQMHLFGFYSDIIAAEYLYNISTERILRECQAHLERWKRDNAPGPGATTRERTSFCVAAVDAFSERLEALARHEAEDGAAKSHPMTARPRAEGFAAEEFAKRGLRWSRGSPRYIRVNEAGSEVGRSLEIVRGVSSTTGSNIPKRIGG